jgi:hypothetical protein
LGRKRTRQPGISVSRDSSAGQSKDLMQGIEEIATKLARGKSVVEAKDNKIGSDTGIRTRILALRGL